MNDVAPTTLAAPPAPPLAPAPPAAAPSEQRVVLADVSWDSYVAVGQALADRPGLRLTYDRGSLEIMTLSPQHERRKNLLRRLVEVLAEELDLPVRNLGSTTFQRADLEQGLEPDECYYIAQQARMRGVQRIDLSRDPPPDLALEVDVTRASLARLPLYAALRVPEVWRFDGDHLHVYRLTSEGTYAECDRSPTFPQATPEELVRFVRLGEEEDDTAMVRQFRAWVCQQLAPAPGTAPNP